MAEVAEGASNREATAELFGLSLALRAELRRRTASGQLLSRCGGRWPASPVAMRAAAPGQPSTGPPPSEARNAPAGPTRGASQAETRFSLAQKPQPSEAKHPLPDLQRPKPAVAQAAPTQAPSAPDPAALERLQTAAAACADLDQLREAVAGCQACNLHSTRQQTVFMDGPPRARVLFVGEAPGFHEDRTGIPFVGPSGELLTAIIEKGMGLSREQVAIANVLKCRPPDNRDPLPVEKVLCTNWLDRQIDLIQPELLIALGRHAAGHLLGLRVSLNRMRGKVHERAGRKVICTFHPSYLLRNPAEKKSCWQDIQLAMETLAGR